MSVGRTGNRPASTVRTVRKRTTEHGATLVEYALLLTLIAMASFLALKFVGGASSDSLSRSGSSMFAPAAQTTTTTSVDDSCHHHCGH